MRGKVDENMPIESAGVLRTAGWECDTVFDEALVGAEDPDIGARCQAEGRVLFTLDMDFADIRAYCVCRHRRVPPSEAESGWCARVVTAVDPRSAGGMGR